MKVGFFGGNDLSTGIELFTSVILFCVRVPVLSEQITDTLPRALLLPGACG
jgi:hypothetical protein